MTRKDPFKQFEEIVEQMLNQARTGVNVQGKWQGAWNDVAIDVAERDGNVVVTADIPGYSEDELDIKVKGDRDVLSIEATSEDSDETEEDGMYLYKERTSSTVRRDVKLPGKVVPDEAEAKYTNGVLSVTLPKEDTEESDGTEININ